MSGPPGPPFTPPPSGIGKGFAVGVTPIGTIPSFNFWSTILAQYANTTAIVGVISSMFSALDMTENFDNFYDAYFNLGTAYGEGLNNWGRILQVSRNLNVGAGLYIGWNQAYVPGGDITTWGFGAWYNGSASSTSVFALADPQYRALLLAKAAALISDGSIPSINKILSGLFPNRGNAYVIDNQNMSIIYNFTFPLSAVEQAIVSQSGVLPKPAGVSATVVFP